MPDDAAAIIGGAPVLDGEALARVRRVGQDALLRRMIELFFEHAPGRLDSALQDAAPAAVMKAAHSLKSSAGNLGLERVTRLAAAIEVRAAADDPSYDVLRPALARAFADGRVALERELERMAT
ncbi:MAG: Hpt domain-containing protein [Longimicrobiales bacterium]